jgi:hypothetical protein
LSADHSAGQPDTDTRLARVHARGLLGLLESRVIRRLLVIDRNGREDPGDLDREMMAKMDDSSGKRMSLGLVSGFEVVYLSLNLGNGGREDGSWVRDHLIHDG